MTTSEKIDAVKKRIKNVRIAMLTTLAQNGHLHSRPMATNTMDDDGTLWFFTDLSSEKISEISRDNAVSLSYADPDANTYVVLQGQGEVVNDPKKKAELWSEMLKAWFPKGLDDPDLTLLKVTPHEAEYWDGSSSRIVVAFNLAKALLTGQEYNEGEHEKVSL